MDTILNDLRKSDILLYKEIRLLDEGDVFGCLETALERMRRAERHLLWVLMGMLFVPVVFQMLSLVFGSGDSGTQSVSSIPLAAFIGLTLIPSLLERRFQTARIETLSIIWHATQERHESRTS